MSENIRKDFSLEDISFSTIALLSSKINVLIVGGGRAGLIKAKSFAKKGCSITIVSPTFIEDFYSLADEYDITLVKETYKLDYIVKSHLVVIATDNSELNEIIRKDCNKSFKLYLDCSDFTKGNFINTVQRDTENIVLSINTKKGSPRTSMLLAEVLEGNLKDYENLAEFAFEIREKIKTNPKKDEVMKFICSKDFYYFYSRGFGEVVLNIFYGDLLGVGNFEI